jgi:hypothetical protein
MASHLSNKIINTFFTLNREGCDSKRSGTNPMELSLQEKVYLQVQIVQVSTSSAGLNHKYIYVQFWCPPIKNFFLLRLDSEIMG